MSIKEIIPLFFKLRIVYWKNNLFPKVKLQKSNQQRIWFFLAADYGNLGDVAITQAQLSYLQQRFPMAEVVEIPISQTLEFVGAVRKVIGKEDVVTLVGGGNMSDLYPDIEFLRRLVVKNFSRNVIVSFPQSIHFTESMKGRAELNKTQKVYSKHPNLTLLARDKVSYERMKNWFPKNTVKFVPDIVLYMDKRKGYIRDNNVIYCLRNDKEKSHSDISQMASLKQYVAEHFSKVSYTDTQINDTLVRADGGEKYLNKLLEEFSHAGLVITDRLHGMILAYITGTPAIVFDNSTKKISAAYEWIKDCGFIHLANENTNFENLKFVEENKQVKGSIDLQFKQLV